MSEVEFEDGEEIRGFQLLCPVRIVIRRPCLVFMILA